MSFRQFLIENAAQAMTQQWADMQSKIGHPNLVYEFLLRNGKAYEPAKYTGKMGQPKLCYMNSWRLLDENLKYKYVEGIVAGNGLPIPIMHAWVLNENGKVLDCTLKDSMKMSYFGVVIPQDVLRKELLRKGTYGVLETEVGPNWKFLLKLDPQFRNDPKVKTLFDRFLKK